MRELGLLDWLIETCVERTFRPARGLVASVYVVLAVVAVVQVVNPGAAERISSQSAGRVLFALIAGLLVSVALLGIADVLFRRPRSVLEPGAADALLHLGLACVALELSLLARPISVGAAAISHSLVGFCLIAAGLFRLARSALSVSPQDEPWKERRLRALARRDGYSRGAAFTVFGALAIGFVALGMHALDPTREIWGIGLSAAGALALLGYGLHTFWTIREEDRMWAM